MTQPTAPQSTRKVDAGRIPGKFAISGGVEIRLDFFGPSGQAAHIMLHGRNPGTVAVDSALANSLLASLGSAWATHIGIYVPTDCALGSCQVRDMSSADNAPFLSTGSGQQGTSTSPLLPLDVALVLTESIDKRGRGAKGRVYLPYWAANADAGNGLALPAVKTAMDGMGIDWKAAIQGAGLTPAVAKPARREYIGVTGTLHLERTASMATVMTYTCRDLHWDTQRRRDR